MAVKQGGGVLSMVEETKMENMKDRGKSERGNARMAVKQGGGDIKYGGRNKDGGYEG
jgi:hypothetical protein